VIDGFEIRNSGASSYGIFARNSGITIRDCDIHDTWRGVGLVYGSGTSADDAALVDDCPLASRGLEEATPPDNPRDRPLFRPTVLASSPVGVCFLLSFHSPDATSR